MRRVADRARKSGRSLKKTFNDVVARGLAGAPPEVPLLRHLLALRGTGGNLVNDALLAAFALEHDARIATRDTDFARFAGLRILKPF